MLVSKLPKFTFSLHSSHCLYSIFSLFFSFHHWYHQTKEVWLVTPAARLPLVCMPLRHCSEPPPRNITGSDSCSRNLERERENEKEMEWVGIHLVCGMGGSIRADTVRLYQGALVREPGEWSVEATGIKVLEENRSMEKDYIASPRRTCPTCPLR